MVKLKFEKKYIDIVLDVSKDFFLKRGFKLNKVVENSRDGCYIEYKKKTKRVCIYFCPTNDIIIHHDDNTLLGLFRFLYTSKSNINFISLKEKIEYKVLNDEYKTYVSFLKNGLSYIENNNLLDD